MRHSLLFYFILIHTVVNIIIIPGIPKVTTNTEKYVERYEETNCLFSLEVTLILFNTLFHLLLTVISNKRYTNPLTVNDAFEEVAQSQNYVSSAIEAEIRIIEETLNDLQSNATFVLDENEKELASMSLNSTKKLHLLVKFAEFLEVDVSDCLYEAHEAIINVETLALNKFTECVMAVIEEAGAFSKDTISELKTYYFLTFPLGSNLENCRNLSCIEKTLSPLTQLTNEAMIYINNLSGNTIDLIRDMNRSFNQCAIGHIVVGEAKILAITNAVAKCINDKVSIKKQFS